MGIKLAALLRGPFHSQPLGILVGVAFHHLAGQRFGNVAVERARHHAQLAQLGKRFQTRNNGYGDAHLAGASHKLEVFLVVVEQLRHGIARTQVLLHLQILHVALQIGCFLVFLGVAGHTKRELRARMVDFGAIHKIALVELLHLPYEVGSMAVAAARGSKHTIVLGLVATQQQHVLNT